MVPLFSLFRHFRSLPFRPTTFRMCTKLHLHFSNFFAFIFQCEALFCPPFVHFELVLHFSSLLTIHGMQHCDIHYYISVVLLLLLLDYLFICHFVGRQGKYCCSLQALPQNAISWNDIQYYMYAPCVCCVQCTPHSSHTDDKPFRKLTSTSSLFCCWVCVFCTIFHFASVSLSMQIEPFNMLSLKMYTAIHHSAGLH